MAGCPDLPPIVWKSDFHGTREAFALLDGVVDVYLADFKFGNDSCARRIAGVENYRADPDAQPHHGQPPGGPDRPPLAAAGPL